MLLFSLSVNTYAHLETQKAEERKEMSVLYTHWTPTVKIRVGSKLLHKLRFRHI